MKYKSLLFSCLLGTAGVLSTQAIAGGSIGGDCCADLEERVAELEATTVRKGNRKVTLTISGNVHRGIILTDETNYTPSLPINHPQGLTKYGKDGPLISDTDLAATRIGLYGLAAINRTTYVGYRVEFNVGKSGGTAKSGYNYEDNVLNLTHNEILLGSRVYGNLYIGQGYSASDFAGESDLSGTNYIAGGSASHYNSLGNLDGFGRVERVRYESPSLAGFKVSASWQENNNWDAALNYKGTLGDFQVVGAVAYYELGQDQSSIYGLGNAAKGDAGVTGSISALHKPTGLSLTFAAGETDAIAVTNVANNIKEFWYLKAGLQRKLIGAGKTYLAVDYHNMTVGSIDQGFAANGTREIEKWGVQLVQDIDAAAMKVYASYWNADHDGQAGDYYHLDEEVLMIGASIDF